MKEINVYEQYFAAEAEFFGVPRRGAAVRLTAMSEAGEIAYTVSVSFFPHADETDFGISYDAFFSAELYRAKGRRSRKREADFLERVRETADALAEAEGARIFWDQPLIEPRRDR